MYNDDIAIENFIVYCDEMMIAEESLRVSKDALPKMDMKVSKVLHGFLDGLQEIATSHNNFYVGARAEYREYSDTISVEINCSLFDNCVSYEQKPPFRQIVNLPTNECSKIKSLMTKYYNDYKNYITSNKNSLEKLGFEVEYSEIYFDMANYRWSMECYISNCKKFEKVGALGKLPEDLKLIYTSSNKIGSYEYVGAIPCVGRVIVDCPNIDISKPTIYSAIRNDYLKLINGVSSELKKKVLSSIKETSAKYKIGESKMIKTLSDKSNSMCIYIKKQKKEYKIYAEIIINGDIYDGFWYIHAAINNGKFELAVDGDEPYINHRYIDDM